MNTEEQKLNHSPLPWKTEEFVTWRVRASDGSFICKVDNKANAGFIVQAVNSYYQNKEIIEELAEACRTALSFVKRVLDDKSLNKDDYLVEFTGIEGVAVVLESAISKVEKEG